MPLDDAWVRAIPPDVPESARSAWARSDWPVVAEELFALAEERGDSRLLAPVVAIDLQLSGPSQLAPRADRLAQLPSSRVADAALAFLAVRGHVPRSAACAHAAVRALRDEDDVLAASFATCVATILSDRAEWAEAAAFVEAAMDAVDAARRGGVRRTLIEELWFRMMSAAVIVEWNTFDGSRWLDELAVALVVPRARNLLRAHHAPALVAMGQVLASRGDFGAGAVSIARGIPLLAPRSLARASAQARLAFVKYRQGDWPGARRAARLVSDVDEPSAPWIRSLVAAIDALEPATGGDLAAAAARTDEATRALAEYPSILAETMLLHARIALAIGANDWGAMVQMLENADEPGYRRSYTDHEWPALRGMALRNAGRLDRYRDLIASWSGHPTAEDSPYYWAHVALLAQIDDSPGAALEAAQRARAATGDGDDPLGRTWVRIVVGTMVSLYGDATEGMESYEAARAELAGLGASGFVRLCTRIIAETAAHLARSSDDDLAALTSQQRRVAELVAEGFTSAEIGEILYLSKKTIDFHVANILSRLGLTTRRELKRRLSRS